VCYEVLSFSKPQHWMAKVGYPISRHASPLGLHAFSALSTLHFLCSAFWRLSTKFPDGTKNSTTRRPGGLCCFQFLAKKG